jgi:outer membrane biosynthesis protein TonB
MGDAGANAATDANTINKGVVNGSAIVLAKPKFPPTARAVGASGSVQVLVTIDEDGYVIEAEPISGHPLLRAVSVLAAKASRFAPTLLSGRPVKVNGIIVYNFQ